MAPLKVLMLGEVYAKAGRQAIARNLSALRRHVQPDLVIANGESAAGGHGLTAETARDLLKAGVDVITSGNRIFDQREMVEVLGPETHVPLTIALHAPAILSERILRPLNYPAGAPGRGWLQVEIGTGSVTIANLNGRLYVENFDNPFQTMDRILPTWQSGNPVIVDFHAEATSEKVVMGWYLDGRVSAVVGTHNRVATADARILSEGTAHVSDVGMVGPANGVGGLEPELALKPFLSHVSTRARASRTGIAVTFNSVLLTLDPSTGRALSIERIDRHLEPGQSINF